MVACGLHFLVLALVSCFKYIDHIARLDNGHISILSPLKVSMFLGWLGQTSLRHKWYFDWCRHFCKARSRDHAEIDTQTALLCP